MSTYGSVSEDAEQPSSPRRKGFAKSDNALLSLSLSLSLVFLLEIFRIYPPPLSPHTLLPSLSKRKREVEVLRERELLRAELVTRRLYDVV